LKRELVKYRTRSESMLLIYDFKKSNTTSRFSSNIAKDKKQSEKALE
jgi:hypothetical protein